MRNQIPSDKIDHYPDLLSCFRGGSNQRQREEYRRFLYRAIKTQIDPAAEAGRYDALL